MRVVFKVIQDTKYKIQNTSQEGQTLIEALAAIAVAVIIVTSLVTLGIATQRAASTSRNQNQNTRYGEETLEVIRSIRDAKLTGSIRNDTALGCNSTTSCSFIDLFSINIGTSNLHYFKISSDGTTGAPVTVTNGCTTFTVSCYQLIWVATSTTPPTPDPIGTTIYNRTIKVWDSGSTLDANDPSDKVKFVEVSVTWSDQGGSHTSKTTTKLTNFK
jgi:Tfp pilus assembly protein PilV